MNKIVKVMGIFEEGISRKTATMNRRIRILLFCTSDHWITMFTASEMNTINKRLQLFMRVSIFVQFSWITKFIPQCLIVLIHVMRHQNIKELQVYKLINNTSFQFCLCFFVGSQKMCFFQIIILQKSSDDIYYNITIEIMKQKDVIHRQPKQQHIQGPPLDFSFKNIRLLSQILALTSVESKHPSKEQSIKTHQNISQQISQKDIGESVGETKLNIIRTIDVDESKGDIIKQMISKKTERVAAKVVKKTEIRTTSFFLKYNKIGSLNGFYEIVQQVFPNNRWEQLLWIDLSHNRLTEIGKELQNLPQLKNIYLHVNYISSFKEFQYLQSLKYLRTFTIHGNPIENYPQFRVLLSCILPQLQKLDSALLTKRQKERSEVLQKQNSKYPVIQNPPKPPQDSQEEEQN